MEWLADSAGRAWGVATSLLNPAERLSLYYQFPALACAVVFYLAFVARARGGAAGLLSWLLPREVLWHPSARTDYLYFVVNRLLRIFIYAQVFTLIPWFTLLFLNLSNDWFGQLAWQGTASPGWSIAGTILTTLILALILDAALWFGHWLFHVVPELWEFHKVHHSAEVMTPITAARMHPVEEIVDTLIASAALGLGYVLCLRLFGPTMHEVKQFDVNLIVLGFYVAAFNLRHSHVFLRYPYVLQFVFISPAQHQIHHSTRPEHWNRNMGFIFAFWDWAAGTLVSPRRHEELTYGLGTREDGTWRGVGTLLLRPFVQSWAVLRARFRRHE